MKRSILFLFVGIISVFNAFSQTPITIAALRATKSPSVTAPYFITDPGKQGIFYWDSKDGHTADNSGTVIIAGGKRFKRMYSGAVDVRWFGMVADYNGSTGTNNLEAFNAALAGANKGEVVMVPQGDWYISGSINLPLANIKKVKLEIYGNIYFAKGGGFVIEGADQDFRSYGLISGGNSPARDESGYNAYAGTGVYLKNAVHCNIEVNEVKNFRNGILQTGEKTGGTAVGSQYNVIRFNTLHHNHTQIRITTIGTTTGGNWNTATFWYGGQVGRGTPKITYGEGGWYGIVINKETSSNAPKDGISGHMFHHIGFESVEKALVMDNASNISFISCRVEPYAIRSGFDLDPVTAIDTKFIGLTYIEEQMFVPGRFGANTTITATPIWTGTVTTKGLAGTEAVPSITPNKWMITTNKFTTSNFQVNKTNDIISQTGQMPTIQAMMYRLNGVTRAVPYKSTFVHVNASTTANPIVLPPNIGSIRVEANQAKVFRLDAGDLVAFGEEFLVEYLTPQFPISFVRSDNGTTLIAATSFPTAGTYRCVWAAGQYKVSRIGSEFKSYTQLNAQGQMPEGIETMYINYIYGNCTTTLPPAASWPGREITIKNLQAARTVQVIGVTGSDENLIAGRGAMTVKSDGVTWQVIGFYKRGLTY